MTIDLALGQIFAIIENRVMTRYFVVRCVNMTRPSKWACFLLSIAASAVSGDTTRQEILTIAAYKMSKPQTKFYISLKLATLGRHSPVTIDMKRITNKRYVKYLQLQSTSCILHM